MADAIGCFAVAPGAHHMLQLLVGCYRRYFRRGSSNDQSLSLDPDVGSDVYTYQVMPKSLKAGAGLTEAPRGALGHWITSEFRRIVNYQCVVPSTWNACGTDGVQRARLSSVSWELTVGDPGVVAADVVVNSLLKAIHPFDICIACSVHVTDTKGKRNRQVQDGS